jgi:hypothetical protein
VPDLPRVPDPCCEATYTLAAVEALSPEGIVPGHGRVSTLEPAQRETRDDLATSRAHMERAVDDAQDISVAVKAFEGRPWRHLHNAADLRPGNASRIYLEPEREWGRPSPGRNIFVRAM